MRQPARGASSGNVPSVAKRAAVVAIESYASGAIGVVMRAFELSVGLPSVPQNLGPKPTSLPTRVGEKSTTKEFSQLRKKEGPLGTNKEFR